MTMTLTLNCTIQNEHWEKMDIEVAADVVEISCDLGRVSMSHEDFDLLKAKVDDYRRDCAAVGLTVK